MAAPGCGLPAFGSVRPMLAVEGEPFDSPDFLFEPKWDGFRSLAFCTVRDGKAAVRLQSRNGHDLTARFPELRDLGATLPAAAFPALLDGEIVALRRGRPDFHALQQRMGPHYPAPGEPVELIFVVFDILFLEGADLRPQPLAARRTRLESLCRGNTTAHALPLVLSQAVPGEGVLLYEASVAQGFEGIVAKRLASRYQPGRSRDWVKARVRPELDVVVGAYLLREPGGAPERRLHSLLVGLYDSQERLLYTGKVGSGWTAEEAERLLNLLPRLQAAACPFTPPPEAAIPGLTIAWTRPRLVATVAYREWTPRGLLRQPSWKGLRPDKTPSDCRFPDPFPPAGDPGGGKR